MRFAAYMRVSRVGARGDDLLSDRFQREQIERWASSHGHELSLLPPELDESGGREDRPILLEALAAIERGGIDGIAVAKFDRLSRSLAGSVRILERVEAAGGQVRSAAEQIDPSTPEGRMTRNILFSVAQMEREHKAEGFARVRSDAILNRGIHISGRPPLGYRRAADKRLELDPDTAPAMREVFRRRAQGASWRTLATYLQEHVLGRPIAPQSVSRMIKSRVYVGEARAGEMVNPDAHKSLIDRATWEAAQLGHVRPPRGRLGPALLSGVLRCAGCARPMVPTSRSGVRAYRCRRHHAAGACPEPAHVGQWIEGYVAERVGEFMRNLAFEPSEVNEGMRAAEEALAVAEAELVAYQQATSALDGPEQFAAGMQSRAEAVKAARRSLAESRLVAPVPGAHAWAGAWDAMSIEQRRHALGRSLSIVVRKGRGVDPARIRILEPWVVLSADERVKFDGLPPEAVIA